MRQCHAVPCSVMQCLPQCTWNSWVLKFEADHFDFGIELNWLWLAGWSPSFSEFKSGLVYLVNKVQICKLWNTTGMLPNCIELPLLCSCGARPEAKEMYSAVLISWNSLALWGCDLIYMRFLRAPLRQARPQQAYGPDRPIQTQGEAPSSYKRVYQSHSHPWTMIINDNQR